MAVLVGLVLGGAARLEAGYSAPGQGVQPVLRGTVPGGSLFMQTRSTWTNVAIPPKPYAVEASFAVPACDAVEVGRLLVTLWGGTANYTARLGVELNGVPVPGAAPLALGSTNDANPVFSAGQPSVYGSGSGVWLVGIPVPGGLFLKDGTPQRVRLVIETEDGFDGRVNQVTLLAVHRSGTSSEVLEYAVAEGSGDVYRAPTGAQVDSRKVTLESGAAGGVDAARLHVLYTYGDVNQNDRLLFNGASYGGDDVANYDKSVTGLDFGPVVSAFDVKDRLLATNEVVVSVSASDVPGTRETSLRTQCVVLETRRRASVAPVLEIGLGVVVAWPVEAGTGFLEYRDEAIPGPWQAVTNVPVRIDGQYVVILPPTAPRRFYQLRTSP